MLARRYFSRYRRSRLTAACGGQPGLEWRCAGRRAFVDLWPLPGEMGVKFQEMTVVTKAAARNDLATVERYCEVALVQDARDPFALSVLAQAYARSSRYDKAMPLALRMLEIRPEDFDALQIAAYGSQVRGDRAGAFRYAQKLAGLDTEDKAQRRAGRLLRWFAWIPAVRRMQQQFANGQQQRNAWRAQWVRWARDYVSAVNSRPAAND